MYINTAGNYKATIRDAYVQEIGEKKTQAFVIEFETDDGLTIKWNGWMSEKAYPYTLEQLAKLGFDETKAPLTDANGRSYYKASHFLISEVELVVVMEPGLKDPTKSFAKIKWINLPNDNKSAAAATTTALPNGFAAQLAAARERVVVPKFVAKQIDEALPF